MNSLVVAGCTLLIFLLSLGQETDPFPAYQPGDHPAKWLDPLAALPLPHAVHPADGLCHLSRLLRINLKEEAKARKAIVFLAAVLLVFWNMKMIGENLDFEMFDRMAQVREPNFEQDILATSNRIDADIVKQIITKYRH